MSQQRDALGDRLGIFARTFVRPSFEDVLDAVQSHGVRAIQLNLSSTGRPTLPKSLSADEATAILQSCRSRGVRIAAVSATFNTIDRDRERLDENLKRLEVLASRMADLDCSILTLCTGTRDPDNMWASHPDNALPDAWDDLATTMKRILAIADRHDVVVAFEPEIANVISDADRARRLLDQFDSPRLKVVLDVANLLRPEDIFRIGQVIDDAFRLLGPDIALIHLKEIGADGSTGDVTPGRGVIDFQHIFKHILSDHSQVPLIVHGLKEDDVSEGLEHLRQSAGTAVATHRFVHDGVSFRYHDSGAGLPVVFQHGLGGDLDVACGLFQPGPGVRLISFDARYHGETQPADHPDKLSFATFADDLLALLDHLGIEKAVIGGISMGAGLSLNFALRYPDRTLGLVLSRPAWLDEPHPVNIRMFSVMADLIRRSGAVEGQKAFRETSTYAELLAESTDAAQTLDGMFAHPRAEETVDKFDCIPRDRPSSDRASWKTIAVPTLILANHQDPIHPWAMGELLASTIPGAELRELTPKCVDLAKHGEDVQRHMTEFLHRHNFTK